MPVLVGSLGRIPVGALTDRFGGRVMFPLVSLRHDRAGAVPRPVRRTTRYAGLLVGGFFLGIGGTAFAVGVPFVNAWFPPERRGSAIGVFGAGMGGTAISALTTVKLVDARRRSRRPFVITAVVLVGVRASSPGWSCATRPAATVPTESLVEPAGRDRAAADHLAGLRRSTRSPSAATSRSRSTCRPTSRPPTG